jgi:hypothetical protein
MKVPKFFQFLRWKMIDISRLIKNGRGFEEYGVTMYVGRQGAGKTMAMVEYLERMRKKYPKCLIFTNFGYVNETRPLEGWRDLLERRNGLDGVIFAIDEIQNEYDSTKWKDFPESILSQITQQRKQRIKIVCTSQVFTRVVKQLREQCFEVVECRTFAGRWTITRGFDAVDYASVVENPEKKRKIFRLFRYSFIQTDALREKYDSYSVVERMKNIEMLPRVSRSEFF